MDDPVRVTEMSTCLKRKCAKGSLKADFLSSRVHSSRRVAESVEEIVNLVNRDIRAGVDNSGARLDDLVRDGAGAGLALVLSSMMREGI
jgi:hypothetical protein